MTSEAGRADTHLVLLAEELREELLLLHDLLAQPLLAAQVADLAHLPHSEANEVSGRGRGSSLSLSLSLARSPSLCLCVANLAPEFKLPRDGLG